MPNPTRAFQHPAFFAPRNCPVRQVICANLPLSELLGRDKLRKGKIKNGVFCMRWWWLRRQVHYVWYDVFFGTVQAFGSGDSLAKGVRICAISGGLTWAGCAATNGGGKNKYIEPLSAFVLRSTNTI